MLSQALDTRGPRTHYAAQKSLAPLNPPLTNTIEDFFRYKGICFISDINGKAQPPCPCSQKQSNSIKGVHPLQDISSKPRFPGQAS